MFCMQCGTQIPDRAKFCPKCGASQEGAPEAAGAGGQLQEEMLLMQGAGQVIKSAILANTGEVVLTTRKLAFYKGGTIVAAQVLARGKLQFELPLTDVAAVERAKKGLVPTIRLVKKDGSDLHFNFIKQMDTWESAMHSAVEKANTDS